MPALHGFIVEWPLATPTMMKGRVLPLRINSPATSPARHAWPFQVLAANVDVVVVATSLNRDLNVRRVERFLTAAWESGARPVVVLTKVDLARDPVEVAVAEAQLEEVAAGVPVVATSAGRVARAPSSAKERFRSSAKCCV
jgi:putative ribosome biogenesis GTPase RsgA